MRELSPGIPATMDGVVSSLNLSTGSDPLDPALAVHSAGETEEEKAARLLEEQAAKLRSDAIDKDIEMQREAAKKGPKPTKILLLGQSESGKSTTLKNFQLMYEPRAFEEERLSWRSVIQLNLVQSFHLIIDAFNHEEQQPPSSRPFTIPPELIALKNRLGPLLAAEETLCKRLVPEGSHEMEPTMLDRTKSFVKELAVQATWRSSWGKQRQNGGEHQDVPTENRNAEEAEEDPNNPGRVLCECSEDMIQLWNDSITQKVLKHQGRRMQEVAGFFLDQLERVTAPGYVPSDDDILRARLKTLGVTEHRFKLPSTRDVNGDWRIYDVGGHRSQRDAWAPFFDDMNAIIFLAPISCFDQTMAEDDKYNRLQDSFDLWIKVLQNPLLKHTELILFLNKTDLLRAKIESGIEFREWILSYGKKDNSFEAVTDYLRKKFHHLMKKYSAEERRFHCHFTTVTDTKSTKLILVSLEEMILHKGLVKGNLMLV